MYIFQDLYPNDKEIECKSREVVFVLETINLLYNKNDNTVEKYKHSREKTTKKKSIFIVQLEQIVVDWHPNHLV
jgi:hypothetical protein